MNRRINNWPRALHEFVVAHQRTPFAWGAHDCALFAAAGVAAITGFDPAAEFRDTYHTPLGAARIFKARGGFETMIAAICSAAGWPEQPVAFARRGDLVLSREKLSMIGLCLGARCVFPGRTGLIMIAADRCATSWRVA